MSSYSGAPYRTPDGPLLSAWIFNTTELNYNELNKWNLDSSVFGFHEDLLKDKPKPVIASYDRGSKPSETASIRANRRRPTYSAKCLKAATDEESNGSSSDSSDETATAKDIRQNKILQYRKALTKIVKVKTAIFHEKVRVTCSKDGKCIQWYKVKASEDDENKRQLIGTLPVSKITNFKTKVDNLRYLEISAGNNCYLFMFKTRDEREQWQNDFDSFVKFMNMI
ncbi:hypothetical protein, conserved [Babesia bigemina]|uniref:PH domain-containing protein n=1 Tax=Babesia bigemina TaxID=5866 RepID=A0A061D2A5_BABBI|nr:hypothetical protein, conserved [Babesia bigemina]CDR94232.1 hypothetical protein, conserved [Babesia bigemina]|eukprot:XP_012766418.1 hypothetical protein, conserved [Babesia bigemina]